MTLLVVLMFSINPMIYILDQLQEHMPSYWNNRFVAEASMTRGGEELHEDNHKTVPIISESTREERKAGAPPLKKKS
jgi:hypothetical protein